MSIELLSAVLFGAAMLVFAAGAPVGFALGGVAMAVASLSWGPQAFKLIPVASKSAVDSFLLLSIPLFLFMGQILMRSGLGEFMFAAIQSLIGRLRGGLAAGVIVVCALMSAMVGIIGPSIMISGTVAIPPLLKRGYDLRLILGVVMAGGGLGILIPPSVPAILFSSVTKTSIGQMFAGAIGPAMVMIALFIVYVFVVCLIDPTKAPRPSSEPEREGGRRAKLLSLRDGTIAFLLILSVLGSILSGMATPSEAGAVGAVGAVLVGLFYRRLGWAELKAGSLEALSLTSIVVWILVGATLFMNFQLLMGGVGLLKSFVLESGLSPFAVIVFMQLTMLALGCLIDEFIIVVVCAPLFTPIAVSLGFDPVWFGVLMILNMEIAIQTPPYGFALFYARAIAPPGTGMVDIYRATVPFVAIKVLVLILCMVFPELILWLPQTLFR